MRLILIPLLGSVAVVSASVEIPQQPADSMLPGYSEPAEKWTSVEDALRDRECTDRIEQVREQSGQPKLDRNPASAERPLMIAAVDKRIDGCAVMQMKGDVNDIRPLPLPSVNPARLQPAG